MEIVKTKAEKITIVTLFNILKEILGAIRKLGGKNQETILVTDWNKYYDYPTIGALRALIFNKDTNGFNKVLRDVSGRWLIHVDSYFKWVEEQNGFKKVS